ncbi:MAG: DNA-directed RNA polymerase subunit K [Candidatus Thorarchaeota archaeon]
MSKGSENEESGSEQDTEMLDIIALLANVPGIGPKTAEKLAVAGYNTLQKLAEADKDELAAAVGGLSPAKAEVVIEETQQLLKSVAAGEVELTGRTKPKRKKAPEPEPDKHDLPHLDEVSRAEARTKLATGYEEDNIAQGIPIGPKWLTRFERARIIGARALQVSMGAPVLIDTKGAPKGRFGFAEAELKLGVLPMTVRRTLPSGESADIPLDRLLKNTRLD